MYKVKPHHLTFGHTSLEGSISSSSLHIAVSTKQNPLSWDCMEMWLNTREVFTEMCWYNFLLSFKMSWVWASQKWVDPLPEHPCYPRNSLCLLEHAKQDIFLVRPFVVPPILEFSVNLKCLVQPLVSEGLPKAVSLKQFCLFMIPVHQPHKCRYLNMFCLEVYVLGHLLLSHSHHCHVWL